VHITIREESFLEKKSLKRFFDKFSSNYDEYSSNVILSLREIVKDVSNVLKEATSILDVGCSTGFHTSLLANTTLANDVVGIDFSTGMLSVARKNSGTNYGVSLVAADVENIPFKDNSFEGISCCFVIALLNENLSALKEMHRVLIEGGKIVVADMEQHDKGYDNRRYFCPIPPEMERVRKSLDCYQMEEAMKKLGFVVTDVERYLCSSKGFLNKIPKSDPIDCDSFCSSLLEFVSSDVFQVCQIHCSPYIV
jgi:ubiquinone/menaquinone biosynthesis C-methylase UbiE